MHHHGNTYSAHCPLSKYKTYYIMKPEGSSCDDSEERTFCGMTSQFHSLPTFQREILPCCQGQILSQERKQARHLLTFLFGLLFYPEDGDGNYL